MTELTIAVYGRNSSPGVAGEWLMCFSHIYLGDPTGLVDVDGTRDVSEKTSEDEEDEEDDDEGERGTMAIASAVEAFSSSFLAKWRRSFAPSSWNFTVCP